MSPIGHPDQIMRRLCIALGVAVGALACVLLIPVVLSHLPSAEKAQCENNLKLIGLALFNCVSSRRSFPPGTVQDGAESLPPEKRLSWYALISPYIEGNAPRFPAPSKAWDDEANRYMKRLDKDTGGEETLGDDVLFLRCPSKYPRELSAGLNTTVYVGVAGIGVDSPRLPLDDPRAGIFGYDRATPPERITDGMGNTMAVVETAIILGPWRAGGPATVRGLDPGRQPYIGSGHQFGGLHRGGVMTAFADGSVHFIRDTIDPKVFQALATIAGGEKLPPDWGN
jgi:prepilin-type processing-associated H-X9-DG protein